MLRGERLLLWWAYVHFLSLHFADKSLWTIHMAFVYSNECRLSPNILLTSRFLLEEQKWKSLSGWRRRLRVYFFLLLSPNSTNFQICFTALYFTALRSGINVNFTMCSNNSDRVCSSFSTLTTVRRLPQSIFTTYMQSSEWIFDQVIQVSNLLQISPIFSNACLIIRIHVYSNCLIYPPFAVTETVGRVWNSIYCCSFERSVFYAFRKEALMSKLPAFIFANDGVLCKQYYMMTTHRVRF